jgi:hypothetical protein
MRHDGDENMPNPATRGHFSEPRNDPRNAGKFYYSSQHRSPEPEEILFFETRKHVPATGSIYFLSPERHFIIIYTGVYVEQYGIIYYGDKTCQFWQLA